MSHTVTIDIKLKNKEALCKAAEALGAQNLGEGSHRLFSSSHQGTAIKFPNWSYPVIISDEGTVHYDIYNGRWGNQADLDKLVSDYATVVVEMQCDQLGWYHERNDVTGQIVVHHPSGGTITVDRGGQLDAQGFHGTSCQEATLPIEQALGRRLGEALKPEVNEVRLTQGNLEN